MAGFHPIASIAAAVDYKPGAIPPVVFIGVCDSILVLVLFVTVKASSRFAASKLANGLVILAWVAAILLLLFAAFGIIVTWLGWAVALNCFAGDPEYPCPSLVQSVAASVWTLVFLGLPAVILWFTTRRLKNWR